MGTQNDTFILSKQGWLPVALSGALFIFFTMTGLTLFQFLTGALVIFFLIMFRNPERTSALGESASVLSCADGIVLGVEETKINEQIMKKVTILNGLWNASILRVPCDGVMEACRVRHGVSLGLHHPLAENLNEKALLSFKSLDGHEMFVEHMSAQSCFSIRLDDLESMKLKEGSRYGFLARGRTVVYLPQEIVLNVHVGSDVRAGESVIGRFNA